MALSADFLDCAYGSVLIYFYVIFKLSIKFDRLSYHAFKQVQIVCMSYMKL